MTACRLGAATARRPLRRGERGERREEEERMLDRHPEVIKQPNETHCMFETELCNFGMSHVVNYY